MGVLDQHLCGFFDILRICEVDGTRGMPDLLTPTHLADLFALFTRAGAASRAPTGTIQMPPRMSTERIRII